MTTPDLVRPAPARPTSGSAHGRPVVPARGARLPLDLTRVTLTEGFWADRQRTNAEQTFAHCEQWMERLGWLANFDRVADGTTGPDRPGWCFSDSEVYKLMEGLAWEVARTGDDAAEAALDRLTRRVAAAQDEDGYLNTCFGHAGQAPRYSDLEMGHELYCVGHLLQAAVARVRTAGPDDLLVDVARRAADHVCATFGPDGNPGICGHPEIEVGLVELGRALGEERYVQQAALFLDRRGHGTLADIPLGRAYFQDDVPIREADVWRGHAVRALYLSAAAVDVAVDQHDGELLDAVTRQWDRTVARRTYLTGGMGSRHQDEGFGEDWELPPDRAYCETCAGIASAMVSWRLYLATGELRYVDLMERTYFNVVATSPRSDGRAFFYANPLHQRTAGGAPDEDEVSPRAEGGVRAAWFDVSCCPTNVARTLASWSAYVAATHGRTLELLQHASGRVEAVLPDGTGDRLVVDVRTRYPEDGVVVVEVAEAPSTPVTLALRVPSWATTARLTDRDVTREVSAGLATVTRVLVPGEQVRLELDVSPRLTWPDPRIDAVRGCVAVERGPLVLCAQSTDAAGIDLAGVVLDATVEPVSDGDGARVRVRAAAPHEQPWAYGPGATDASPGTQGHETDLVLVPYHRWAEQGPAQMRVWLPAR